MPEMRNTLVIAGSLAAGRGWFFAGDAGQLCWRGWSLAHCSKALPCFARSRLVRINEAITSDLSFDHADRLQRGMLSPCCMTNWNELGEVH